jgi:hypothetical protein
VRSSAGGRASRHLDVVRGHADASAAAAPGTAPKDRVRRVALAGCTYLGRGVRLLGAHFTAFVWTTESGDPERGHGPRRL